MKRLPTRLACVCGPVVLLGACAPTGQVRTHEIASTTQPHSDNASDNTAWSEVFQELLADQGTIPIPDAQRNGLPSLVAGDWLAMRCAIAGGYWLNDDQLRNENTPAYAEVPESWSDME